MTLWKNYRPGRLAGWMLLGGLVLCWMAGAAWGAKQFATGPKHRGITPFGNYRVFPENRPGNGVYLDNRLVYTSPGHTIIDVLPLKVEGRFVFYALDDAGNPLLDANIRQGDKKGQINQVSPGFYHLVVVLNGVVYKKIFRIIDEKILDILPGSKTADGPVAGAEGVVFYHVASMIREDENGGGRTTFGLRLHLARFDDERTRHLDYLITNGLPRLKLNWRDDTRIQISLTDGRSESISVSQFQ